MGTNIGATILLTRVIQQWIMKYSPESHVSKGAIYALALGSNFGGKSSTVDMARFLTKNLDV